MAGCGGHRRCWGALIADDGSDGDGDGDSAALMALIAVTLLTSRGDPGRTPAMARPPWGLTAQCGCLLASVTSLSTTTFGIQNLRLKRRPAPLLSLYTSGWLRSSHHRLLLCSKRRKRSSLR